MTSRRTASVAALGLILACPASIRLLGGQEEPIPGAFDWPHLRGPDHNGVSREMGWLAGWPQGGTPRIAWRAEVGKGHSPVTTSGGLAYTMGSGGDQDVVYCFDAATGAPRWKRSYTCGGRRVQFPGPRAAATIDGELVYTLSERGHLRAWNARNGQERWKTQVDEAFNPDEDYGHCWTPLVVGDVLILSAGRRGLAFDKQTGKAVWGAEKYRGTCASAVPYEHARRRGVIVSCAERDSMDVVGVDPSNGQELWRFRSWPEKWGAFAADPITREGKVFITSGQEHHACARISFADGRVRKDWESRALGSNTGQCVLIGGHIYGISAARKALTCVSWETGAQVWQQKGFGTNGSLMAADGKLIVLSSDGDLVIVEVTSAGYRELRRLNGIVGKSFATPTLSNGRICCRDYEGRVVCLDVGGR